MEGTGKTQDRALAEAKFTQAQHELDRGHIERAEDLAREALEFDGTFQEVRLWLADVYVFTDQEHKASRVLQDLLYMDRENQEAWEKLRRFDAAAANRLERLGSIAPDPFVSAGRASADEFGDISDFAADGSEQGAGFFGGVTDTGMFEDVEEADGAAGELPEPEPPAEDGPKDERGPGPWEYEQDREFLGRWMQEPMIQKMVVELQEIWRFPDRLLPATDLCAHLDKAKHPDIVEAAHHCCRVLRVADCDLMVFAERCMHPFPVQDDPPRFAIPTGLIRGMRGAELKFQIGREIEYLRSGYLAAFQIADLITDRPSRLAGDVATALRDLLHELFRATEMDIKRDQRERLAKIAHAWQQRVALSADRAGWLCCGDLEAACQAIAKTTARNVDEAGKLTLDAFLAQFQGQDPSKLAAIPVKETPDRSSPYAAYRIQMLRWWGRQPQAQELARQFSI